VKNQQPNVTLGLFVRSGTRFEDSHTAGSSFYLKRLAFTSSQFMHELRVTRELELMGGHFSVAVGREQIAYSATVPPPKLIDVLGIIRAVSEPRLLDFEIKDTRASVEEDLEHGTQDPKALLFDLLHQAAFRGRALGQPFYAPYNVEHLNFPELFNFRYGTFVPEKMALVAVGSDIDHDRFVQIANDEFKKTAQFPPQVNPESARQHYTTEVPSTYAGGESIYANSADTHVAIGFSGPSFLERDVFALRALQYILGGGKADASKEGLGGGSSGAIFKNVVEKNNKVVKEAGAFNFNYSDAGLFGVYGIAKRGDHASELATSLAQELQRAANTKVDNTTLERAKKQFRASVLFNTDTTESLADFLGSGALLAKNPQDLKTPSQFVEGINSVSADDIQRVAKQALSKPPTLAAIGDIAGVPTVSKLFSK